MGFLFHAIKLRFPRAITQAFTFFNIWRHIKFLIIGALNHLGLYKPPPEDHHSSDHSNNYMFILDGTCPSPVPIPIHVVTAAIKKRVPVLKFRDLLHGPNMTSTPANPSRRLEEEGDFAIASRSLENTCTVCFEAIDLEDDVRELCRCTHVFHRDCLDTWVDSGQVTCPLCRSMLLPPKTNLSRCAATDPSPSPPAQPRNTLEENTLTAPIVTG